MAFDLREVFTFLQKRAYAADSSEATQDLIYLLKSAMRGDQNPIYSYDTTADLPNLIDDSADPESVAYVRGEENLYFKQAGEWKPAREYVIPPWTGSNGGFIYQGSQLSPNIYYSTVNYFPFTNPFTQTTAIGNTTTAKINSSSARDIEGGHNYVFGGFSATPPGFTNGIEKHISASSGLTVTNVGTLSNKSNSGSTCVSLSDAFVALTNTGEPATLTSIIDKVPFASDVGVNFGNKVSNRNGTAGITDIQNSYGYWKGDNNTQDLTRFPFAAGTGFTSTSVIPSLPPALQTPQAISWSNNEKGYIASALAPFHIESFPFANVTPSSLIDTNPGGWGIGNFVYNRGAGSASSTAGFFAGGNPAHPIGIVSQLPFANDTVISSTTNCLTPPTNEGTGVSGGHW